MSLLRKKDCTLVAMNIHPRTVREHFLLFLLHTYAWTFFGVEPISVIVDINSTDDQNCCKKNEFTKCNSIEQAYECVKGKSNVTIIIQNNSITLNQQLCFIEVSNIAIQGIVDTQGNVPIVHCIGQAGIYVEGSSNIYFSNFTLTLCIINSSNYLSAVMFKNSSNIDILYVTLQESNASGLTLLDCYGKINLTSVNFTNNGKTITSCTHKKSSLNIVIINIDYFGKYNIRYCVFENNTNDNRNCVRSKYRGMIRWGDIKQGGGMRIILATNYSCGHNISLDHCHFINNEASYGAGLHLQFQNNSEHNVIQIHNTTFLRNVAHRGGGGLEINFLTERKINKTNKVLVEKTMFLSNKAQYGGGLSVLVLYSDVQYLPGNSIMTFRNCTWDNNIGTSISPAVDIAPYVKKNSERHGYLPILCFHNIKVINNFAKDVEHRGHTQTENSGVFLITELKVHFYGDIFFQNNSPSALQAISSGIILNSHTKMTFDNNSGINGGAIALYGFSYIYLSRNVRLFFLNNTASDSGGGIYYHGIDQHEFITGYNCFIETDNGRPENISLIFEDNKARSGKWIYSESFYNCIHNCHELKYYHPLTFANITECLGVIKSPKESHAITSSAQNFSLEKILKIYSVIPGERFSVPFHALDELHQKVSPLISVTAANTSSNIGFEEQYTINGNLVAIGQENSRTTVDVTVIGLRSIFFEFELETIPCPPGFVFKNNTCQCGNVKNKGFKQIVYCDQNFRAHLDKEYWVGYIPQSSFNYSDLYFSPCLVPICNFSLSHLPRSATDLNQLVCGPNRSGIMCGKCVANTSVYFHSQRYSCRSNKYCDYGPLFFFLSEILPIALFFLVVVIFDFTFTSGNIVGFLFFSQYFEPLILPTDSTLLTIFQFPYKLFYGIFNLEYFNVEYTAYCLWKGLDTQDVIAIKYVSIIFSFVLVLMLVLLLESGRCSTICNFRSQISKKYSFLHGLSAFLAICYIQCTKTSFLILRYAIPEGLNGKYHHWYTYYGGMPYFQGKHLVYSIVAIFSLIIVTILPTMVLLLHPLLLQLLSLCKLSEHCLVLKTLQILRIQKCIPFLDCFQSCYKDRYRFFSGLHYVYRVSLLICFMTTGSFSSLLLYVQLFLSLFLGTHALVQPYKKKLHNTLDSLIFLNLSLINLLNIFIYNNIKTTKLTSHELMYSSTIGFRIIQTFLLMLPMLVCIIWLLWKLSRYLKKHRLSDTGEDYDKLQQDHIIGSTERGDCGPPSAAGRDTSEMCDCTE